MVSRGGGEGVRVEIITRVGGDHTNILYSAQFFAHLCIGENNYPKRAESIHKYVYNFNKNLQLIEI
jgi:hypothetical protein